mmetsp:Transcript_31246/g.60893  ORF Transcript_31246/g.60893 Transcript_31246/m.60893 type:complete len:211 (+) Transcript_31246:579-1211(+)
MAEGDIWISAFATNSNLVVGTRIDQEDPSWQALEQGREILIEQLPLQIFGRYRDQFFEEGVPDLFCGAAGIAVSEGIKGVFSAHNLGTAKLYPASLYLHDRKTLVTPNLYVLNSQETIEAFIPEQCQNVRAPYKHRSQPKPSPTAKWGMPYTLRDDDIAVIPSKTGDLDLWMDKWLGYAFFFSDPIKQAICDGGYAKLFDFKKCKEAVLH